MNCLICESPVDRLDACYIGEELEVCKECDRKVKAFKLKRLLKSEDELKKENDVISSILESGGNSKCPICESSSHEKSFEPKKAIRWLLLIGIIGTFIGSNTGRGSEN